MNVFDFIECFTTTFLRAHSWLNWVEIMNVDRVISINYNI